MCTQKMFYNIEFKMYITKGNARLSTCVVIVSNTDVTKMEIIRPGRIVTNFPICNNLRNITSCIVFV